MKTIPVSTRLEPTTVALIRDGLIAIGYPPSHLTNNAQILKAATLFSLNQLRQLINFSQTPSTESLAILYKQPKLRKTSDGSF